MVGNMDIMALVDKLEDLIAEGKKVPLTSNVVVNEQKLFEMVDEIRASYPDEIKQARWIVKERQQMLDEAEKQAQQSIEDAKRKALDLASETEVVNLAQRQARDLIDKAREQERQIRLGAEDYADEMLANLEVNLGKLLAAVQRGRDRLQGKINENTSAS